MSRYINICHYTDIDSYEVLADNGNTLTIRKVRRDFRPHLVPGGFSAICTNNKDQRMAPIVPDGEPFTLTRRGGRYGVWEDDIVLQWDRASIKPECLDEFLEKNGNARLEGDKITFYAGFRKDGTPRKRFRAFPPAEAVCKAFYDYNY